MELLTLHLEKAGYDDEMSVVQNIDFTVSKGEMVGLIGPNRRTILAYIFLTLICVAAMIYDIFPSLIPLL
ncbi:hypothetical protein [Sutcliffiella horikoshii]|uniref:hypothetical protein n=1 Tax=Sutcliffiella horikoshii TaxID=79883 RepID=UPI0021CD042C|nr:hypothetical protein [Sutcliffiella horikoshii]